MSNNPAVSVCIASYNHARFLSRCLDSVLNQTHQDFEIIIVDDGSQDGSHELLLDYQARFPEKIKYLWHPGHENKGVACTTNTAMIQSKGKYIAWIGSDDIWCSSKLDEQVKILENEPEIGLVYCLAKYIDENDLPLSGMAGVDVTESNNPLGLILTLCYTPAMTVIVRRSCLDLVGLFDETLIYQDWDLMIRIFSHFRAAFINKSLVKYRIHGRNLSLGIDSAVHLQRDLDVLLGILRKSENIGGALLDPLNMAILDFQIAFHLFCNGSEEEAERFVNKGYQKDSSVLQYLDKFYRWESDWRPVFYTPLHKHFGLWAIGSIRLCNESKIIKEQVKNILNDPQTIENFVYRGVHIVQADNLNANPHIIFENYGNNSIFPRLWKKQVLSKIYIALAFISYGAREFHKTRLFLVKGLSSAPLSLLTNKGVWSIAIRSTFK